MSGIFFNLFSLDSDTSLILAHQVHCVDCRIRFPLGVTQGESEESKGLIKYIIIVSCICKYKGVSK